MWQMLIRMLLQEAQRDTISAFEEYMDACMTADWAADKRALFDAALPDTAMPGPASQLAGGDLTSSFTSAQFRSPLAPGTASHSQEEAAMQWPGRKIM